MKSNEKPVIMIVVTLFLALILVYIIYFRIKKNSDTSLDSWNSLATESWSQFASSDFWMPDLESWSSGFVESINLWISSQITSGSSASGTQQAYSDAPKVLSSFGVKPLYSDISIARQLWLRVLTSFTDQNHVLFGYLGTGTIDSLASTVKRLWWDVLAIETRNDIMKNHLRWDRVLFINIPGTTFVQQPTEQRLLVAMIVTMGEERRFIQAPLDQYYAHKDDMKLYFEKLYKKVR